MEEKLKDAVKHPNIDFLKKAVDEVYYFRDHFFETHEISEASAKSSDVKEKQNICLHEFKEKEKEGEREDKAVFLYLKGRLLNLDGDFNQEAEGLLSRAVKLNPTLVEAWNELGESYWKKGDWVTAKTCFEGALQHKKNKVSLRCLSMVLRQLPYSTPEESIANVELGLSKGKEAVSLDTTDGLSWSIMGNAYFAHFFLVSQNPKTLKQAMSAYAQAEKDVVSRTTPELHYNKGIALKYEEEFLAALDCFKQAQALDPTWEGPKAQETVLLKYIADIVNLIELKGKLKAKKVSSMVENILPKHLGPYGGGEYRSPSGASVNLTQVAFSDLEDGLNKEKVILGKVICSVHTENSVPFTFCMIDRTGQCLAVTLYNLSPGKGVIIGDSVAIAEPFFTKINLNHKNQAYSFQLVRVESPLVLVINGKKASRELQAGVQMSTFTKTD